MSSPFEMVKDSEGNNHLILEKPCLYDDSKMGESLSDFEFLKILNEADNSLFVSKVRSLSNNKIYAMKRIELKKLGDNLEECKTIISNLKQLNNPHIIKYYKTFEDNKNLYLIMEYMNNSDINGFIKGHQILDKKIKEEVIWSLLLQCLSAIEYLHQQNLGKYGIRLSKIFISNEQNAKIGVFSDIFNETNNWEEDINLLGKYFYTLCFSHTPELTKFQEKILLNEIDYAKRTNDDYSKELMEIIYNMIDKKFDSTTFYKNVKEQYAKKYPSKSSIEAVLRCLYSYSYMNKLFLKNEENIRKNKENKYINYWYLEAIRAFSGSREHNLEECIEVLRHAIESENSKLDGSREIDPLYLLSFLLEKIHKELNEIDEKKDEPSQVGNYVINSSFNVEEEDGTNREQMRHKFFNFFNVNVHSIISDFFFGFLKTKRNCQNCKTGKYSFSNFCFAAFDLSGNNKQSFDLIKDGFIYQYNYAKKIEPDKPDRIYCERCMSYQLHLEFNRYYIMNNQLVISFLRGNNFQNNSKVNFTEELDLSEFVDEKDAIPCKYYLVGAINRLISEGKEEFIYWAREPDERNSWHTYKGFKRNIETPINEMQTTGQVILLFYNNNGNIPK
jgi:hypothetical protein